MLKKITLTIILFASGLCSCFAAAPDSISLKGLTLTSFSYSDIPDFYHPVCALNTFKNKQSSLDYYVEGGVCPADVKECKISAIMKLNGKLTIMKEVTSTEDSATYKNEAFTVSIKRTLIKNENMSDEESDVKYNLVIKTKNDEHKLEMFGHCGF